MLSFVGNWGPFFWALFVGISFPSVAVCPCVLSADQAHRRCSLLQPKDWIYSVYASVLSTYISPLQFPMTETLSSGLEENICCSHIYHRLNLIISIVSEGSARILPSTLQFWHCEYENVVLCQSTWYWRNTESNQEKSCKDFTGKKLAIMSNSLSAW